MRWSSFIYSNVRPLNAGVFLFVCARFGRFLREQLQPMFPSRICVANTFLTHSESPAKCNRYYYGAGKEWGTHNVGSGHFRFTAEGPDWN
jgi:hypothetical protein